jgi:tRNA nucleotidyltransferase (CCA-adding enzyme)
MPPTSGEAGCERDGPPPDRTRLGRCVLERLGGLPAAAPVLALEHPPAPVHLVGGAVRDLLLDRAPGELDLAVEGDAVAVARALGGELTVHDRFGTCSVARGGWRYDLARTRRERYPAPGALPLVEPAPLAEDLLRRDFTVNAIAVALAGAPRGRLAAAPGALEDLAQRRLRVLHERSFEDDPTRLLRLARYAARLSFAIEPATRDLAERAVAGGALATVSGPRVGAELRLLAREPDPLAALEALAELGLDRALGGLRVRQPEAARRALALLGEDGRADLLALAAAAEGIAAERLRELLDRFAFEAGEREAIIAGATRARSLGEALARARGPAQVARAATGARPELVALAGAYGGPRALGAARDWLRRLRHVQLEISGEDLLAAGFAPGPAIGAGLRAAREAKLEGRVHGREAELQEALRAAAELAGGREHP